MKKHKKNRFGGTPLRMKMFWILTAFVLFAILVLWVLQVVLMDNFYQVVATEKMNKSCDMIAGVIADGGDVRSAAYSAAEESGACVSVYMIKNGSGIKIADAHVKNGCYVHDLISSGDLGRIYGEAVKGGDSYVGNAGGTDIASGGGSILCADVIGDKGAEYMLLLSTESFPMGTMATTVTVQLSIITVLLLMGAGVLAVVISRKITRPVSELCDEAERLAARDYGVSFSGGDIEEINRLGDTIGYAAAELERSDRMQKELIANITHDLRTPLTMISGYSEVMRDIPGEVTPENIQVIIDESARLSALVNDVLEVSRAQSRTMMLNPVRFCISDAVEDVVNRYGVMLKNKGYSISYESSDTGVMTFGDETKLIQALCNLINNAVNFTGDDKKVFVRLSVSEGFCRIEVSDTGCGIPADELESIWDRYYRARDFQNKGIAGSGLGLSIVKHIMLLHDASFGVRSVVGAGSTFWFEVKTFLE